METYKCDRQGLVQDYLIEAVHEDSGSDLRIGRAQVNPFVLSLSKDPPYGLLKMPDREVSTNSARF